MSNVNVNVCPPARSLKRCSGIAWNVQSVCGKEHNNLCRCFLQFRSRPHALYVANLNSSQPNVCANP
jgi:hypothetical protein